MAKSCYFSGGCSNPIFSKKLCLTHWKMQYGKPLKKVALKKKVVANNSIAKPRKPLKKISDKHAKELRIYSKLRVQFLKDHPVCAATIQCSGSQSSEIHHKAGRLGPLLLDVNTWLPICRRCHAWVTDNSSEAIKLGLSTNRIKQHKHG